MKKVRREILFRAQSVSTIAIVVQRTNCETMKQQRGERNCFVLWSGGECLNIFVFMFYAFGMASNGGNA